MFKEITALECHCEACAHEWIARELPKRCASCKSRKWNGSKFSVDLSTVPVSDTKVNEKRKSVREDLVGQPECSRSKKLTVEQYFALSHSDQDRARREGEVLK